MASEHHSLLPVLAFSSAGITTALVAASTPQVALDIGTLIGVAVFVLCVLFLGYGLTDLLVRLTHL